MSVLSSSVDRAGRKIIVGEGLLTVLRNGIFFLYHGELAEEQTKHGRGTNNLNQTCSHASAAILH
jgi:hypothetical protein